MDACQVCDNSNCLKSKDGQLKGLIFCNGKKQKKVLKSPTIKSYYFKMSIILVPTVGQFKYFQFKYYSVTLGIRLGLSSGGVSGGIFSQNPLSILLKYDLI